MQNMGQMISAAWHRCKLWVFGAALIIVGFLFGRLYDKQQWQEVATRQNDLLTHIADTDENILAVLLRYRHEFKGRTHGGSGIDRDAAPVASGVQGGDKLP